VEHPGGGVHEDEPGCACEAGKGSHLVLLTRPPEGRVARPDGGREHRDERQKAGQPVFQQDLQKMVVRRGDDDRVIRVPRLDARREKHVGPVPVDPSGALHVVDHGPEEHDPVVLRRRLVLGVGAQDGREHPLCGLAELVGHGGVGQHEGGEQDGQERLFAPPRNPVDADHGELDGEADPGPAAHGQEHDGDNRQQHEGVEDLRVHAPALHDFDQDEGSDQVHVAAQRDGVKKEGLNPGDGFPHEEPPVGIQRVRQGQELVETEQADDDRGQQECGFHGPPLVRAAKEIQGQVEK